MSAAQSRPLERSLDFRRSGVRLLRMVTPGAPELALLLAVLAAGTASVALAVVIPKILGHATDVVVSGATNPGGVDFREVGESLGLVLALITVSASLTWLQLRLAAELVQRVGHRLRETAQTKLARLPLTYFDRQPRGEILSRTTNDIDNITQTLQQASVQIMRALLTLIGVLAMMVWISPLLALVVLATVPVSVLGAVLIGRRAQPQFVRQWDVTGKLNGHVEEMYTGHAEVVVFGRKDEAVRTFEEHNEALYASSFKAQFISGFIQPAMTFVGNLNYVLIAIVGGLRVASGTLSIGDVQAFVQYSFEFNGPITQIAAMANLLQSGVASAERVFELLDAEEESADPTEKTDRPERAARGGKVAGRVSFEKVAFSYEAAKPLIKDLSLSVEPGQTVAIVGPTGAGKTTLVNLLMRFYEVTGGRITLDGVDISTLSRGNCAPGSAWSSRTPGCSAARSPTTSRTGCPATCRANASWRRRWPRTPTASSVRSPTATTRSWTRRAAASARARSNCSPSRGRSSSSRPSWCSTRRPAPSTPAPKSSSSARCRRCARAARAS